MSKKLKITTNTSTKHKISSAKPNAQLAEMNENQQAVCVSWWLSNSSISICSALKARIVDNPSSETFKWVYTGDLAENNWRHDLNKIVDHRCVLSEWELRMISNSLIPSKRLIFFDVFTYILRASRNRIITIENGMRNMGLTTAVNIIAPLIFKFVWMASNNTLGNSSSTELPPPKKCVRI